MISLRFIFCVILLALVSCQPEAKSYSALELTDAGNTTPTVDLSTYTLIVPAGSDRLIDAKEIMSLKRRWPLAMQSLDVKEFEEILGKKFTFKSPEEFFNRADYIQNRIRPDDWKITYVKYDNVTLQFIDDVAMLSYRNHIRNENSVTHETEVEHIMWVDTYARENGKWKINSAHAIDYAVEPVQTSVSEVP